MVDSAEGWVEITQEEYVELKKLAITQYDHAKPSTDNVVACHVVDIDSDNFVTILGAGNDCKLYKKEVPKDEWSKS